MIGRDQRLVPHADVVATTLPDGGVVLLHMGTKRYFTLNETGSKIWELAGKGMTVGEIGSEIERVYEVEPERAAASVERLASELAAEKLVGME